MNDKTELKTKEDNVLITLDTNNRNTINHVITINNVIDKRAVDITIGSDGILEKIECFYIPEVFVGESPMPLKTSEKDSFYIGNAEELEELNDFYIVINENELTFVFDNDKKISNFSEDDKLEVAWDEDDSLNYIKYKNLTKNQYDKLINTFEKENIQITEIEKQPNYEQLALDNIEKKESISILQSAQIGSKAWGYEVEESDIDLRFVYVRKLDDYLSVNKIVDTIEMPITNKLDILGYDFGKFIKMINEQNTTAYEDLFSPIQYDKNEIYDSLKEYAEEKFDSEKISTQYQHILNKRVKEFSNKKEVKTKFYLYILRIMGMINYVETKKEFPICDLDTLMGIEENRYLQKEINRMIDLRKQNVETLQVTPGAIDVIQKEENRLCKKYQHSSKNYKKPDEKKMNELYLSGIRFGNNKIQEKNNEIAEMLSLQTERRNSSFKVTK